MTNHTLICSECNQNFNRNSRDMASLKNKNIKNFFCSHKCQGIYKSKSQNNLINCTQCKKQFFKRLSQIKITKNHFCSSSCAATYNNTHKTHGNRRSKLEIYIETQLKLLYPTLEILFNNKQIINSELDVYVPSLKLAFELNGIFHYEPIYGSEKLSQIQNNDNRKFQACLEQNIELCIIDSSKFINFKESKAKEFLTIITNVINTKRG